MSTINPVTTNPSGNKSQEVLEPSVRVKRLIEMSHNIEVDRNISISKYFHSGRELIKSASALEKKGDIEKAFVLYLRYMTLFVEKLIHHPEYNKADRAEKQLVKNECNNVFDLAENLKKLIIEQYTKEYNDYKKLVTDNPTQITDTIQKRSVDPQGSSPHDNIDVDEIDRKFDFSSRPLDDQQEKEFDPFQIEQLKQSFNSN